MGYFLISVAEIRYRHDLVRLCHKFHFCPFQMKIPHIDEEKEMHCVSYRGLCLGFFVLRVPNNFWSHAAAKSIADLPAQLCWQDQLYGLRLHHWIFIFTRRVEIRQSYDLLRNIDLRVL